MKIGDIALAAAGIGLLLAAGACSWLLSTYLPGYTAGALYLHADIVAKLMMMLLTLLYLPIAALGMAALVTGRGQLGLVLAILGAGATVIGLFGGAWVFVMVQLGLARVGPVPFAVIAPQYAEAALSLAMGLFGATLALGARKLGDRRRWTGVRSRTANGPG